jgi:hypothetical protein
MMTTTTWNKKRVPSVLGPPRAQKLAKAARAVFEGEDKDEEMKEEEDFVRSERRHRELLPLSIHRKRKTTTAEFWKDFRCFRVNLCWVRSEEKFFF